MSMSDCTGTKYLPMSFSTVSDSDAWKNTAATAATKAADCCRTKAKCGTPTCPAGYKAKASVSTTDCTGDAASCSSSTCCEADVTKCGGLSVTCATTHYKYGQDAAGSTTKVTAWKNTAATDATKATACCTTRATCSAYTCPAGYKDKVNKTTTSCLTAAATCTANTHAAKCPMGTSCSTSDSTYAANCN